MASDGRDDPPKKPKKLAATPSNAKIPAGPQRMGKERTAGAVGLRSSVPTTGNRDKVAERRASTQKHVDENAQEHMKKVWDKLDAARRHADEKSNRLRGFQPAGSGSHQHIEPRASDRGDEDSSEKTGDVDDFEF